MAADILQHPSAPVTFDPPDLCVAWAREVAAMERLMASPETGYARAELIDSVLLLCERFGYQRIARIVRNGAALAGEEVR